MNKQVVFIDINTIPTGSSIKAFERVIEDNTNLAIIFYDSKKGVAPFLV